MKYTIGIVWFILEDKEIWITICTFIFPIILNFDAKRVIGNSNYTLWYVSEVILVANSWNL